MEQRRTMRVTVRLDVEYDADLIAWLEGLTPGGRSALIRDTWRRGLHQAARQDQVDINELRSVIAEEMERALATHRHPMLSEVATPQEEVDMEAKWGAKFDRMMGGLADPANPPDPSE